MVEVKVGASVFLMVNVKVNVNVHVSFLNVNRLLFMLENIVPNGHTIVYTSTFVVDLSYM
ncbi:hypothetical protein BIFBRE_05062 [Bifidobacterium breve DSM 20213 = JCM 1192]|uniref:Uncharacterized protein n=1 Tax=Bifidobacterium breve DSM 20213 = JCM 1192 TaxID=518634 RepID=D4BSH0_BIFBR|nr:hypothetical protein BIFBRE_05062 [Bifidobacterium breve DSM 20213 = JCM 1192]